MTGFDILGFVTVAVVAVVAVAFIVDLWREDKAE